MDRSELRFRILFEYYNELHSPAKEMKLQADQVVRKMEVADYEKNAAQVWLIDSGYVEGSLHGSSESPVPHPLISRINSYGINFVESVMDTAFTKIKDEFEDINELSKIERIQKFAKECLDYPLANRMCEITYAAIVEFINNASSL